MLTIGAATLADIYDPSERGRMMGIYYAAPLLGPSMGPLLGGILTQLFNWRATFWFLSIFGGMSLASFMLFRDTFRRERSLTYQAALRKTERRRDNAANGRPLSQTTTLEVQDHQDCHNDKIEQGAGTTEKDVEAQTTSKCTAAETQISSTVPRDMQDISLSLKEVNPITPLIMILRRCNNLAILIASGMWYSNLPYISFDIFSAITKRLLLRFYVLYCLHLLPDTHKLIQL